MTGQWVRDRIIKHSEHDETEDRGFYLFLGRSRSIDAWKDDPERAEEHGRLKDIEFYIRVFKSYELGTYVSLADFGSI